MRIKSKEARANWAELLRRAEAGETTVIEHYNRPVATLVPYRPARLRAVANTYNDQTGATVSIRGVPMSDAAGYPDHSPSADGHLSQTEGWVLIDRNDDGPEVRVTAPTLWQAITAWSERIGHRVSEIVIDPIYPPDPNAGRDDW